jgi:hypothetical protein
MKRASFAEALVPLLSETFERATTSARTPSTSGSASGAMEPPRRVDGQASRRPDEVDLHAVDLGVDRSLRVRVAPGR